MPIGGFKAVPFAQTIKRRCNSTHSTPPKPDVVCEKLKTENKGSGAKKWLDIFKDVCLASPLPRLAALSSDFAFSWYPWLDLSFNQTFLQEESVGHKVGWGGVKVLWSQESEASKSTMAKTSAWEAQLFLAIRLWRSPFGPLVMEKRTGDFHFWSDKWMFWTSVCEVLNF